MIKNTFLLGTLLLLCIFSYSQDYKLIDSLQFALDIATSEELKADLLIKLSQEYDDTHHDSAIIFADKALEIADKIEDDELLAKANMQIGSCFFWTGNYSRVITYYFKALRYYESLNKNSELLTIYFNIGLIYDNMNEEEKAREYYFKSLDLAKNLVNADSAKTFNPLFGRIYNNIGVTYADMHKYEEAIDYYNKSMKYAQITGNSNALQFVYNNMGEVYKKKGEFEKALYNYEKSLQLRKNNGDIRGIGLTYFYMGECYVLMEYEETGIDFYEKALRIADSTDYLRLKRDVTEKLSEEYAERGNYKSAFKTHLVYKEMDDSLNFIESTKTAAMLEMEYKFDKFKEQKANERKRRDLIYSISAIILFSIVCIVSLLYFLARTKIRQGKLKRENLKLEKQQLKQELEFKNKELTTNVMYLFKKNELNNQVVEKLLNLKYELKKSNQKPLNDIILELQNSIDKDVWDEFELRFQQVHESFYKNLNEKFPELTSNETRLCAFLKLNMTTKEIASITQKSLHSIDVARTRLRKKLNLTNTDVELNSFLAQL